MDFKITFPSGYQDTDVTNDNIDINIILKNGDVHFATLFTLVNIANLMSAAGEPSFWSTDMLIVKDLSQKTIRESIQQMIDNNYLVDAFEKINVLSKLFPGRTFEDIPDMSDGLQLK